MSHIIKIRGGSTLKPFANMTPTVINKGAGTKLPPVSNDRHKTAKLPNIHDTSTRNSYAIMLHALAIAPQTTIDFRDRWGVMSPAQRISELKKLGHVIIKTPVYAFTSDGVKHKKVAKYVLIQLTPQRDAS